ncbi:MAG: hydroxyacid dehydrogenase [Anaerolineae bacterium]|nr:hydroxyacid dehydrogenase [Anaerolineae bacterium]
MKIVITEFVSQVALDRLRPAAEVVYDPNLWRSADLRAHLSDAEALIVRNQTRVDGELLDAGPELKVVGRLGVGLDNIELPAARQRGVQVVFARSSNAIAVAEYVFAAMFAAARRLAEATRDVQAGRWDRQTFTGYELYGKTLGIIGVGDIGGRLARRAQAFGLRILASDPLVTGSSLVVAEFGVQLTDLDTLLAESDFISLHVPLTRGTAHLVNADRLGRMKPTAWLINTARGGVIDEAALYEALQAGRLGGAALDVRAQEPPPSDDRLATLPHVLLTPHIAGITQESHVRTAEMIAEDVLRVLRGQAPLNAVG